jgi:hypothetical protein
MKLGMCKKYSRCTGFVGSSGKGTKPFQFLKIILIQFEKAGIVNKDMYLDYVVGY